MEGKMEEKMEEKMEGLKNMYFFVISLCNYKNYS